MRILVVSPFAHDAARGNSVAAGRLVHGFSARGHAAVLLDAAAELAAAPVQLAAALHRAGPVDVALILHAGHGATAARLLRAAGTPYVVSLRGTDANELIADPTRGPAVRDTLAGATRITVFHAAMREQVQAQMPGVAGRLCLVANGIELPVSNVDYRARLDLPPGAFVFLSLAGLRAVKRPLLPIAHLAPLAATRPALRFVRAGPVLEPALAADLHQLRAAHPWVVDAGEIPRATIDSFLRLADVFVATSRTEGMPHAVREAMLASRAMLLSDIAGHRAMAEPGREALFFGDGLEFQAAARRLMDDRGLRERLGAAARTRADTDRTAHDEIGDYLAVLAAAAAAARPAGLEPNPTAEP